MDRFYETVKQYGFVINGAGEKFRISRYWLPFGYINESTVKYPQKDGSVAYHTPCANGESKDGVVALISADGKTHTQMNGTEFLAWLGESFTTEAEPKTEIDPIIAEQVANVASLAAMYEADYAENKKKGWVSASDRKKSKNG